MKNKSNRDNNKKPVYKQWWFWLIIVLLVFSIGSQQYTDEEDSGSIESSQPSIDKQDCSDDSKKEMIDLGAMSANDIAMWAKDNGLEYRVASAEYSDTVARESLIKQNIETGAKFCDGDTLIVTYSKGKAPTKSEENALAKANSYLKTTGFSKAGLIHQLEYEGFSTSDATYAVENCGADWNEQAYKKAKAYLRTSSFSLSSLIHQLEYEKFTSEEAKYGANKAYSE